MDDRVDRVSTQGGIAAPVNARIIIIIVVGGGGT
jgi:hypothetical protein